MEIFKHKTYRELIEDLLSQAASKGSRSKLAEAAGCSPSWITRVLNGTVQLTPDQALGIARHFHLTEAETDYFLSLVDFERAATPALRERLKDRIEDLRSQGRNLANSIRETSSVKLEDAILYYSSWIYPSVHVACMIEPQTAQQLMQRLHLSEAAAMGVLRSLAAMNLLVRQGAKWAATSKSVHLPANHPMANVAHIGWRQKSAQFLQEKTGEGFHYSAIHCLSQKDIEKLRTQMQEFVLSARKTIEKSPSESVAVFCLDWFELK